jgi:hypothetical protein
MPGTGRSQFGRRPGNGPTARPTPPPGRPNQERVNKRSNAADGTPGETIPALTWGLFSLSGSVS